jgi:D-alanyl-D-alanine-carboxypeptidase/D-alanyl-D-alanine-endopeptidase
MMDDVLRPLLSAVPDATGVAVAARDGEQRLVLVSGTEGHGDLPVGTDTRFELGSLTKTFTALLLATMTARGEVAYDDPVSRYVPAGAGPWRQVTLAHLATHSAGLPRLPPGLLRSSLSSWYSNPYHAFSQRDLLAAMRRTRFRTRPGERVYYSNFGVALLGVALARAVDRPFEDLLTDRVLSPLDLTDTGCAAQPQATGHLGGRPRPAWEIPGMPGAGALRSTAKDMLSYLDALVAPRGTALPTALTEVTRPRVANGADQVCLVWNLRRRPGHDLLFHSGGTRGFTSFAGFSPQAGIALVAMANAGPRLRSRFVQRSYNVLRTLANSSVPAASLGD